MKFIFQIKIKEGGTEEQYIDAWKKGSATIQTSAGAQGTILYRNADKPGELIAIATWMSREERDLGLKKLHEAGAEINEHRKYGDILVLGNYEEVAQVDPK